MTTPGPRPDHIPSAIRRGPGRPPGLPKRPTGPRLPGMPRGESEPIAELKAIGAQLRRLLPAVDPDPKTDPAVLAELQGLAASMRV